MIMYETNFNIFRGLRVENTQVFYSKGHPAPRIFLDKKYTCFTPKVTQH